MSFFFKVAAVNSIGVGPLSNGYNIVSATFPDSPTSLTRNDALTSMTTLSLSWNDGISNGGSSVIDYRISFDQG